AGFELYLATDVIHLVGLRFFEAARALFPVGAGVHHAHPVEPWLVEAFAQAVVKARVALGLGQRRVGKTQFMPAVAQRDEPVRLVVETRVKGGPKSEREIAIDVNAAVEVRLQQADVAEGKHARLRAGRLEGDGERRPGSEAIAV